MIQQQTQFQTFLIDLVNSKDEVEREKYMRVIKRLITLSTISALRSELYKIEKNEIEINRDNETLLEVITIIKDHIATYEANHIELYSCAPEEITKKETFDSLVRKLEVCLAWINSGTDRLIKLSRFDTVRSQVISLPLDLKLQFHSRFTEELKDGIDNQDSPLYKIKLILKYEIELQSDFTRYIRSLASQRVLGTFQLQYRILYLQNESFSCKVNGRSTN
jgi:hypothetical protein